MSVTDLLVVLGAGTLGAALVSAVLLRRGGDHRRDDDGVVVRRRLDAGLRVLSGEHLGLGRRWRHGRATVEPGRITLTPYRWGVRLLPRPAVSIDVASVDRDGAQRAPWRSMFSVSPAALLVPVTTRSGARLQLAVVAPAAGPALDVLEAVGPEPRG